MNIQNKLNTKTNVGIFMSNVYMFMSLGLVFTALASLLFAYNPTLLSSMYNIVEIDGETSGSFTVLGWITLFMPLILLFVMIFIKDKVSSSVLLFLFLLYAAIDGVTLSFIFLLYTSASILTTFLITAGMFFTMSIVGYTTKRDLTNMGSILFMALIGLIIAMVVNMFMHNEMMDYIISGIAVIVFTGLIVYDTNKLKNLASHVDPKSEEGIKQSIMGALDLYLDFINLFLHLLRFFGDD